MKSSRFITVGLIAISSLGISQSESEGLLFSRSDILGTARYTSMGGAFAALGGDATASSKNPAGIAVFRNNEFSLTPAYHENFSEGIYYNKTITTGKSNLNIGSFSLVGVQDLKNAGRWKNTAMSVGMNRTATYHQKYSLKGENIGSSILDDYTNIANSLGIASNNLSGAYPFDLYLLWKNYLIDNYSDDSAKYFNNAGVLPIDQGYSVTTTGAKRELYFNFGGNYDDKLYIGAGVANSKIVYERTSTYSEYYDPKDTTTLIDEFSQTYYDKASGRGYSAVLGAIYRPVNALRIGISWKSPEVQRLAYTYESDNVTVEEGISYEELSPDILNYKYRIASPMQTTAAIAYTIKKIGLVSLEADYVDYRMINMRGLADSDPFTNENAAIDNLLKPTINVRGGIDYRITPFISARAGYALFGNPYTKMVQTNGKFEIFSLGGGYQTDDFFIDGSYQYKWSSDQFTLYDPSLVQPATLNSSDHRVAITIGVKI
jgi:hypothetical protein